MKKLPLIILVLFFITCPALLYAAPRTVAITWTMSDTTDVQGYKVYYANNSSMVNKTWISDCSTSIENPANTFTITCSNVELEDNQTYYFTIAALISDNSESSSTPEGATYTEIQIAPVQNFRIVNPADNIAPTAVISASTTSGIAPLTVSFNASGSSDVDGSVVSYSWNFGDGSQVNTSASPSHTFSSVDSFEVSLVVTDDKGAASLPTQINITTTETSELVGITNISPDYPVATLSEGDTFYTDRTYVITSLPTELQNVAAIKTANDDKYNTSSNFLTFDVDKNATLYIAYDSGASPNPSWLINNFTKTEFNIATTNYDLVYSVWERTVQAGTVTVPGNKNGNPGSVTSNYFVFVK